ncbi:MAG: isocitrate lyase/phosphoenolpyruvate mutase family protein [Pseudomonadota bacterium]
MSTFRELHRPGDPFILANVWDIGTARMLAALGARALATSSAALAFTLGRPDMGNLTRDESLAHAESIVAATPLPVQGDFENGFGHDPDTCAETVRLAGEIGLAGLCIEDMALPAKQAYDRAHAVERVRAAAAAARALSKDMVFFARADGIMNGSYDLSEAIIRIQAFEAAGADGVYVPVPGTAEDLRRICQAVSIPVNVLAVAPFDRMTRAELGGLGVARISLGSALARATHRLFHDAALAIFDNGDFSLLTRSIRGDKIDALLERGGCNEP